MRKDILGVNKLLHGADYNPEQWLDHPDILKKDIELMKKANCNVVSVGMFSWAMLEPEEGVYKFEWLKDVIDNLYANGIYTILSTPSGARPNWLAKKYPEVLRVGENRVRNLFGVRHNHCYTSPIYREKTYAINSRLAETFAKHPGVILWHLSNEYGGECHCELCQAAFRKWLKEKYGDLESINKAWWTVFWSHTYTNFDEIESPAPHGEMLLHGLNLDWKRFVSYQTIDFMQHEKRSVHTQEPHLPVTANMMYYYDGINYFDCKDMLDIISWDSYPVWHKSNTKDYNIAVDTAMMHDIMRSLKKQPFLLMESTPSMTNWQNVSKLKKPQMHKLSSMQAIAHGSDSVQYFQWRKSRGASEKLHGSVVDHYGESDTRVFQEVSELGKSLQTMSHIVGSTTKPQVAILFDWENRWAVTDSQGPRNIGMYYKETVQEHYKAFWELGIPVEFIDMSCDISDYSVVVAPMMYMTRNGIEDKIASFVKAGGTFVTTYWSGVVNETDLCHLGGTPYGLMDVVGLRSEEIDGLFDGEYNSASGYIEDKRSSPKTYSCIQLCDRVICNTAAPLLSYDSDFYKGEAALTVNTFGKGTAYYLCTRFEEPFYTDFYKMLVKKHGVKRVLECTLPKGVTATCREKENIEYIFIQNFNEEAILIDLSKERLSCIEEDKDLNKEYLLQPYEVIIAKR